MITWTPPDASRAAMNGHAARPLVVEFVGGIPGAGKTTVARACGALATSLGYPVYLQGAVKRCGRAIGTTRMALAFVRAPLFWRFLYHAFRSPPLSRTRNESVLAHRCRCMLEARWYFVVLYEFTRRNANSVVILDQWMSRKLDLAEDERATTVLRFLARSDAYFDRYYVFLDVPIDVSTDRAWRRARRRDSGEERGWVREVFLSRRALREFYAEIYPSYLRRYSLFRRHGMKVLRLDGERPAEDNARLIVERIIRPYPTAGEGPAGAPPKERGATMSAKSPAVEKPRLA